MPPVQRGQFILFSLLGAAAGSPLLFERWLSPIGLAALSSIAALTVRTAAKWRSAKQLYQQLLVSYQSANRLGSSRGALLYLLQLAEAELGKQAALSLFHLARQRLRATRRARSLRGASEREIDALVADYAAIDVSELARLNAQLLAEWKEVANLRLSYNCHGEAAVPLLLRTGVVEVLSREPSYVAEAAAQRAAGGGAGGGAGAGAGGAGGGDDGMGGSGGVPFRPGSQWIRLRSHDDALSSLREYWQRLGDADADSDLGADAAAATASETEVDSGADSAGWRWVPRARFGSSSRSPPGS
eukprot:6189599-Pleurochrysis_carterae.AAC.5